MQLREVLGDAARDAPPVEVTALAYDNRLYLFAHGAGCRAFAEVPMAGQYASFGAAIAAGVDMCESLARKEGWIK